jgi:hypothetical protein
MPRFALAAALLLAGSAAAEPPSPLDLVRGLREAGMPDLALEYLQEVEKGNPGGELKTTLPLERAKVRLELAQQEEDEGTRDAAIGRAKAEFQAFLAAHAKHPRAPEASLALARVVALEANTKLARVGRLDPAQRPAAAAATRPLFRQAADLFGQAAKQLTTLLDDPGLDPARRRDLAREAARAELDRGINQFRMADTFDTGDTKQVIERGNAIDTAQAIFQELGKRDPNDPAGWVARAWVGACLFEKTETTRAEDLFRAIRKEATQNPAGADGVRMVEFFEAQTKYLAAGKTPATVRQARDQVKAWLDKDRHKTRLTPERVSALYYHAVLSEQLARQTGVQYDKKNQLRELTPATRAILQDANDGYKRLAEFDNPYADRAAAARTGVIRLLVGNADQPAASFTDFEQCQMAALVQLSEAGQKDAKPEDRAGRLDKAIRLLERCRQLAGPAVPARDQTAAALQLAYAYLTADRPHHAAVLGEYLARQGRPAGAAAKGGFIGVQGYLAALAKLGDGADDAKAVDRDRAVTLARYLDATYPADPMTDAVRFRLGRLYFDEQDYKQAFDALGKVTPGYSGVAAARVVEGQAAYALAADRDSPLSAADRQAALRKAAADAAAVPEPPAAAAADDARLYLALRTLLAQLHVAGKDYARAEQVAAAAADKAKGFANLDDGAKKAAAFAAEEVRLRAVYAQAAPLLEQKKFKELGDRLAPALTAMARAGPANQKLDGAAAVAADALDRFRQEVISLALQGAIREGGGGAAELFDLLEKFGGSADALVRLVAQVRPQIDELRREGKAGEADQLAQSVTGVLEKQAADPKLPARTVARLGQALRTVGAHDKAVAVLNRVEPPKDKGDLARSTAELTDPAAREAVVAYHLARLELARSHRQAKQFDKAGEVLKDALGDDKAPGWARSLEYRKEAVLLSEDKAADAPQGEKLKLWKEAVEGWTKIAGQYRAAVTRPPKDAAKDPGRMEQWQRDREKLIPIFLLTYGDLQRCLARANTQLIPDPDRQAEALGKIGRAVYDLEAGNPKSLTADVREAFGELLRDYPGVLDGYKKAGGKAFLPAVTDGQQVGN